MAHPRRARHRTAAPARSTATGSAIQIASASAYVSAHCLLRDVRQPLALAALGHLCADDPVGHRADVVVELPVDVDALEDWRDVAVEVEDVHPAARAVAVAGVVAIPV